jgi:hypothetical protein
VALVHFDRILWLWLIFDRILWLWLIFDRILWLWFILVLGHSRNKMADPSQMGTV